ncbi:baseplate J/gp47 family protein, partial [Desulfovibrio sp. DV]|uniref:baseplate J/gp47 family protein n=1 Tax=Desulfovibrio sp. DV TaxID=1844708 RepID=UPI00094B7DD5
MYTIPTFEAIRAAYLRDVKNLLPDAATDADSDHYIRATAEAAAVEGLYQHQLWIARQVLPDTADPEYLERHAALRGISRKPAIPASGDLLVQGTPGTVVPLGESVRHVATGLIFLTTDQAIIGTDGWTVAPVAAAKAGVMPVFSGEPVLFVQAPEGVLSQAGLTLSGGVAAETDAALLARLLDYMQHPPGGGNAYDFKHWALTVAGVSRAWTFPHRRGLGSVDVAVLGADGPCPPSVLAAAQAVVDEKRPAACKDAWVLSPTPVNVTVKVAVRLDAAVT